MALWLASDGEITTMEMYYDYNAPAQTLTRSDAYKVDDVNHVVTTDDAHYVITADTVYRAYTDPSQLPEALFTLQNPAHIITDFEILSDGSFIIASADERILAGSPWRSLLVISLYVLPILLIVF
ncbi:MAG: hypothetical protein AAFR67_07310, partial [Chloroflexota bacterium]